MLQVKNISTGYGKKQVLFDVSLEVKQAEIVLLIGSNGSGKSTLLKAIYGLLPPFQGGVGQVYFNNEMISGKPASQLLKKGLMYIPQKNICFDNLTVKENLDVAGIALNSSKILNLRIQDAIQHFPVLQDLLKQRAGKLSGGEKQILALAMASLHEPKMILMDEPLTGLSHRNIELVKKYIVNINNSHNTSFLIIEHRLKEAIGISHLLLGMKLGKIVGNYTLNSNFDTNVITEILI